MSDRSAAERATRVCLAGGFWLPLAVCTWLALTPSPPDTMVRIGDVLLHGGAFTYLTFALGLAHPVLRRRAVAGWMVGYGVLIELVQSFEPARTAELKDLLVDAAGIGAGLLLLAAIGPWSRRVLRAVLDAVPWSARG